MDSQGQAVPASEPPTLEVMNGASEAQSIRPQQVDQPQQSDDSQMEDVLQEGSSHSSSQMPELEQMEGGPEEIVEEDPVQGESAPEVDAMEVEEAPEIQASNVAVVGEQVLVTDPLQQTSAQQQVIIVVEEQVPGGVSSLQTSANQVQEVMASAEVPTEQSRVVAEEISEMVPESNQMVVEESQVVQQVSEVVQENVQGVQEENQVVQEATSSQMIQQEIKVVEEGNRAEEVQMEEEAKHHSAAGANSAVDKSSPSEVEKTEESTTSQDKLPETAPVEEEKIVEEQPIGEEAVIEKEKKDVADEEDKEVQDKVVQDLDEVKVVEEKVQESSEDPSQEKQKEQQPDKDDAKDEEPAPKKQRLDSDAETSEQEKTSSDSEASGPQPQRPPDTKIVLTLAPGAAAVAAQGQKPGAAAATDEGKREVVLSFNMQDMLAATTEQPTKGSSPKKAMPLSIKVGVPQTRGASKRAAASKETSTTSAGKTKKQPPASVTSPTTQRTAEFTEAIGLQSSTPSQATSKSSPSSLRRSNRRKSSTPKWRPKDLLQSESEEESEGDGEELEEGEVRIPAVSPVRKRGRPPKPKPPGPTPQKGKKPKVKTEPVEKPLKPGKIIKVEDPDPEWYNGKPKSSWTKREERALVIYIIDWQKEAPVLEDMAEESDDSTSSASKPLMTAKEFDEMNLMIPNADSTKDWKECVDFVSKAAQKPIRTAKACHEFALTIQECMTNEGAREHYNLDDNKVKRYVQTTNSKKPQRGKQAASKSLWTDEEEQAMVVFILHWQTKNKPKIIKPRTEANVGNKSSSAKESNGEFSIMPTRSNLWEDCAKFISRKACAPKRTGAACRTYAMGIQKKHTKEEIIEQFDIESETSDVEVIPSVSGTSYYDEYMQDDAFIFNLWLSEMGKLTSYQEDHVLHRLILKKINRGEFSGNDFAYYFRHLPKPEQSKTANLLLALGNETEIKDEEDGDDNKGSSTASSKVAQFQTYSNSKQRSMDGFTRQMQVNLHQSEKQLKNMREMLNKVQAENRRMHEKIISLKEVIGRIANIQPSHKRSAWSLDMDVDLNAYRKKHLFQWLLLNGYIPRMPKDGLMIPKGLLYCVFTAMEELEAQARPNAVFHLAKALCLYKTNGERVMPANRMPFALLEANIMFFGGKGYNFMQQEGYKRWVETQYAWFGEVWFSLFGGPNMKSLAGEEPKPLTGFEDDFDDIADKSLNEDTSRADENQGDTSSAETTVSTPTKNEKKYTLFMCPEGFVPPPGDKDYLKVGQRWGKLTPLPVDDKEKDAANASPSTSPVVPTGIIKTPESETGQVVTRKSARQLAKSAKEDSAKEDADSEATKGETSAEGETPKSSSMKSPRDLPPSGKRRGKTAAISYVPRKMQRMELLPSEPTAWEVDEVDKFLQAVNGGALPEGMEDIWADPPDFTFEDDFIVPENSDLNKVRLNIVSGTPRAVRRRAVERVQISEPDATIRGDLLEQLKSTNPNAKWWIKTGWCDITSNKALRITNKHEFTGDEDLGDGTIQETEEIYKERLQRTRAIGVGARKPAAIMREDLFRQIADLQNDNVMLCEGLRKVRATRGVYKHKMGVPERAAVDLQVDREISSYAKLLERNQELRARVERALSQGGKARVITLRNDLAEYLTNFTIRQRTLANYVLIFMISDELQNEKPYSWPVRMVPVAAITRPIVETLRDQLIEAMVIQNMEIVGVIRDELTPHLQVCSPDRSVAITQLIADSRQEASTFHPSEMEKYFSIVTLYSRSGDLRLTPQWRHGAVPEADVIWVYNYMNENNASFLEALRALHCRLFPEGYTPLPFKTNSRLLTLDSQLLEDQLRALMAIYIFRHKIQSYAAEGIDFENYLYIPATNPLTQQRLHVRDSVTKLLRAISRQAKDDKDLTDEKKARLSKALDSWFKASVNKWWTADMRRAGNQALLSYVIDEWLPYTITDRKYSAIDVNRPISDICFLSEDLLTSLIINIESENQSPALHPWAATCQDVNTFVHLIKNPGQRHNDSRQIMHPQITKKLCIEFAKAVDPDLEFYYYWGDHEKTLYNILLNLNDPRTKRSASGPKYRKKCIGPQGKQIKEEKEDESIKEETMEVDEEEHSKDTTEEDEEEQIEVPIGGDGESTSSSTPSKIQQTSQSMEIAPVPISISPVGVEMDQLQHAPAGTIVTVTAPTAVAANQAVVGEAGSIIQHASAEDIIAAELLRQIEASLQAGVAVVTVTESSQPEK